MRGFGNGRSMRSHFRAGSASRYCEGYLAKFQKVADNQPSPDTDDDEDLGPPAPGDELAPGEAAKSGAATESMEQRRANRVAARPRGVDQSPGNIAPRLRFGMRTGDRTADE